MTGGPQDGRVRQIVAGMVGLEGRTAGLIDRLRADADAHPGAGAAFERFAQTAAAHRERLGQHAQELGRSPPPPRTGNAGSEPPDRVQTGRQARRREGYTAGGSPAPCAGPAWPSTRP